MDEDGVDILRSRWRAEDGRSIEGILELEEPPVRDVDPAAAVSQDSSPVMNVPLGVQYRVSNAT